MFLASVVSFDLAVIGSALGVIATVLGGVLYIANLLNSIENKFIAIENKFTAIESFYESKFVAIESKRELNLHKIKSWLKFLKYDLDSVKGYLSKETDYQVRQVSPNTGADFLNE